MANINLLPWREEQRNELTQEFGILMGIGVAFVGAIIFAIHMYIGSLIDYQVSRNKILEDEIQRLDKALKQISSLESTKAKLLKRMNVIQSLQQTRPQVVHLFDEITRTVPEGIFLDSITQTGENLTIEGVAESNGRVSAYMRNIEASEWLATPKLKVIKNEKNSFRSSQFTLTTQTSQPKDDGGK